MEAVDLRFFDCAKLRLASLRMAGGWLSDVCLVQGCGLPPNAR